MIQRCLRRDDNMTTRHFDGLQPTNMDEYLPACWRLPASAAYTVNWNVAIRPPPLPNDPAQQPAGLPNMNPRKPTCRRGRVQRRVIRQPFG